MQWVIHVLVNETGPEHRPKPSLSIVRVVKQLQCCPSAAGTFHIVNLGVAQAMSNPHLADWGTGVLPSAR